MPSFVDWSEEGGNFSKKGQSTDFLPTETLLWELGTNKSGLMMSVKHTYLQTSDVSIKLTDLRV